MKKLLTLALLSTLVPARAAHADEAMAQYELAWQAMDRKDYEEACELFDKSYAATKATGPLQGLAQCFEARGLTKQSLDFWREAQRQLPADSPSRGAVSASVARLQVEVPRVSFRLPESAPPNVRVELDGKPVALEAGAIEIDPAVEHVVVVSLPGHEPSKATFRLGAREQRTIALSLGEADSSGDVGPVRGIGIALTTLGSVGLVTAAITSGIMLSLADDIDAGCDGPGNTGCSPAALNASEDAKALGPWNAAAWIVGVAALGAGIPMLIVGDGEEHPVTVELRGPGLVVGTTF